MPKYDYICEENGLVVEVSHRMNESLTTWAELCQLSGQDPSSTPADTPVKKLMRAASVVTPNIGEWKKR